MKSNKLESGFYYVFFNIDRKLTPELYYISHSGNIYILRNKKIVLYKEQDAESLFSLQTHGIITLRRVSLADISPHYLQLVMALPRKNPSRKTTKKKAPKRKIKKVRKNCWA